VCHDGRLCWCRVVIVRQLNAHERRVVVDALRRAASETRSTAMEAARPSPIGLKDEHVKQLLELAQRQDRLATELDETTNVRLEKL